MNLGHSERSLWGRVGQYLPHHGVPMLVHILLFCDGFRGHVRHVVPLKRERVSPAQGGSMGGPEGAADNTECHTVR